MTTANFTTNYELCKMDKKGAIRGSKYYAFATVTPTGELIETAEVVSAKLDRKAVKFSTLAARGAKQQAARDSMFWG